MKKLILLFTGILIALVAGNSMSFWQADAEPVHIELFSEPFPMRVGPMELIVSVTDSQSNSIEGANVYATTQLMHHGSPPINDPARRYENDLYYIPVIWTMVGQASVIINAELPDGRTFSEEFIIFVYMIPPDIQYQRFLSEREIQADLADIPDNEYWIVVPQGAQEITGMHFINFVPSLIELSVSGQNTLVIRNDDFVPNQVGPFYVAAGETLRQRFDEPGIFSRNLYH